MSWTELNLLSWKIQPSVDGNPKRRKKHFKDIGTAEIQDGGCRKKGKC